VRAVFDPNLLVSATGPPRELLHRWVAGAFELVVSAEILFARCFSPTETSLQRLRLVPRGAIFAVAIDLP